MANNILKGKRGIIFGALDSKSIAWKVAEHEHTEGAKFVLTNAPIDLRMGTIHELFSILVNYYDKTDLMPRILFCNLDASDILNQLN